MRALLQHERPLRVAQTLLGVDATPLTTIITLRIWERRETDEVRKEDKEEEEEYEDKVRIGEVGEMESEGGA